MHLKTFPAIALGLLLLATCTARADVAVPGNVLNPKSVPEAWNVIRLATANVEKLLQEKRLGEIPIQVSLCSPALRALAQNAVSPEQSAKLAEQTERGLAAVNNVAIACGAQDAAKTSEAFATLRSVLKEIAQQYDARIVNTEIHFCPMHPDFVSVDPATPCAKCGMTLLPRRIPYSFIYISPGEASMKLTATASGPIEAGRKVDVKVTLKQRDGTPVLLSDLMVMHTQPIHLLIVDPSLGDYHHEHPTPTETPGEYAFSFTPGSTAPHRIWADVVPVATGLQEYPVTDLQSAGKGDVITETMDRFSASVGGLDFRLSFLDEGGAAPRAKQIRFMKITVTEAGGSPVRRLEPVMSAFAHLVGFYDDYGTVLHLHPIGGDLLGQDARGGPSMNFKFYLPKAGFIRLYCQVLVDGKMVFAPFNVNVAP